MPPPGAGLTREKLNVPVVAALDCARFTRMALVFSQMVEGPVWGGAMGAPFQ